MQRPHGFMSFIRRGGYYGMFLSTNGRYLSLHKSRDPKSIGKDRLSAFWWLAGKPIASRLHHAFKTRFEHKLVAEGLFELDLNEAIGFIEKNAQDMGTWTASENDMIRLMDMIERHKSSLPNHAPTPLAGIPELPKLDNPALLNQFRDSLTLRGV